MVKWFSETKWTYDNVELQIQSLPAFEGRKRRKAKYKTPVRFTENKVQINVGPSKWRRWKTVNGSLEEKIRNKL